MNKEKKNETISVRVDWETKQLYHRLIKEYQKSGPELIKFLLENNISRGAKNYVWCYYRRYHRLNAGV